MKKTHKDSELNAPLLIITGIVTALVWRGIYPLYKLLGSRVSMPVTIGTALTLLLLAVTLTVFTVSSRMMTFRANVITGSRNKTTVFLCLIMGTALFFPAAAMLQAAYQTNVLPVAAPVSDYIFLIDDSGSMETTDPENTRFSVIPELLEKQPGHIQYMVYSFASTTQLEQPMTAVDSGWPGLSANSNGKTFLRDALERVMADCDSGVWKNRGNAVVILITDGYASDIANIDEVSPLLNRYADAGITINTVGFGNADSLLMNHISSETGGRSVSIGDIAQLQSAVETAVVTRTAHRDLLSRRVIGNMDPVYAVLRVLFLVILGTLMSFLLALCYGNSSSFSLIIRAGLVKSLLAGLVLEAGQHIPVLPQWLTRFLAALLLGIVIAGYGHSDTEKSVRREKSRLSSRQIPSADNDDSW